MCYACSSSGTLWWESSFCVCLLHGGAVFQQRRVQSTSSAPPFLPESSSSTFFFSPSFRSSLFTDTCLHSLRAATMMASPTLLSQAPFSLVAHTLSHLCPVSTLVSVGDLIGLMYGGLTSNKEDASSHSCDERRLSRVGLEIVS